MFDKTSRYYKINIATMTMLDSDGLPREIRYVIGNGCTVLKIYGAVFPLVWRAFHHFSGLFTQVEKVSYHPPLNRLSHRVFYKLRKDLSLLKS